jgi:DNA-binding NarL/FixJ family response regulator
MQKLNRDIRILVHDDHEVYREGMVHILKQEKEFQVVAVLEGNELEEAIICHQPDVILTAIQSEKNDIAAATRTIATKYPHISVLAVSLLHQEHFVIQMLNAGAKGCLLRNARKQDIVQAIKTVYRSDNYFSPPMKHRLYHVVAKADVERLNLTSAHSLSEIDKKFIKLLCRGLTLKEISQILHLKHVSLEHKKKVLYERLEQRCLAGLFNYAVVNGLHDPYEITHHNPLI